MCGVSYCMCSSKSFLCSLSQLAQLELPIRKVRPIIELAIDVPGDL